MRDTAYTSAVSRIRANENYLLTNADVDRLLGAKDAGEVLSFLSDKGYGGGAAVPELFSRERERAWDLIREIAPDFSLFFPLLVRNDFHNAKAVLKGIVSGHDYLSMLLRPSVLPVEELKNAVSDRKFSLLPEWIAPALESAYDALTHTGDGQLADVTLDRAYLEAVLAFGGRQKDAFVRGYCFCVVEMADLRIAARSAASGKPVGFLENALVSCSRIDTAELTAAALEGVPAAADWMEDHGWPEAAAALRQSPADLERWCDNALAGYVREARYAIFGISPLYQYLESKNAEISAVRIIYTGKRSGFSEEKIKSYLRALV